MRVPTSTYQKLEPPGGAMVDNQLDFSTLYDRYAPALLGVILRIISDEREAHTLLETTFRKVRSEIGHFKPEKQPVFTWLLQIARSTALEALNERRQVPEPVMQLTATGNVITRHKNTTPEPADFVANTTDSRLSLLLDSVLFKNCTPEEAAVSVGLPVETVRQQLRLAMQQLRNSAKK